MRPGGAALQRCRRQRAADLGRLRNAARDYTPSYRRCDRNRNRAMVSSATPLTRYEPVIGWPSLPHGMSFREATSVGVGPDGRVYVFNRGQWPVMVFDAAGRLLDTWGAGEFVRPHGIAFDVEGNLYLTDVGLHTVQKRTPDGKLLMQIGEPRTPSPPHSGIPFNQPTQVAVQRWRRPPPVSV